MIAQEENMFRRTDCHFADAGVDRSTGRYRRDQSDLINGLGGRVYLDTAQPRVCIRGPEDRARADLGYPWLPRDEVFPFYELRAAAEDLRGGKRFSRAECRRRIDAQVILPTPSSTGRE